MYPLFSPRFSPVRWTCGYKWCWPILKEGSLQLNINPLSLYHGWDACAPHEVIGQASRREIRILCRLSWSKFQSLHIVEDWVTNRWEIIWIALSKGEAMFRETKRGCQLRQPKNLCVMIESWLLLANAAHSRDIMFLTYISTSMSVLHLLYLPSVDSPRIAE